MTPPMQQQITKIILEMIGEDKTFPELESDAYDKGYAKALQDIREKVPEVADKILLRSLEIEMGYNKKHEHLLAPHHLP